MNQSNLDKLPNATHPDYRIQWVTDCWDFPLAGWMLYKGKWAYFSYLGENDKTILYGVFAVSSEDIRKAFKQQILMLHEWGDHYSICGQGWERPTFRGYTQYAPQWMNTKYRRFSPNEKELIDIFVY